MDKCVRTSLKMVHRFCLGLLLPLLFAVVSGFHKHYDEMIFEDNGYCYYMPGTAAGSTGSGANPGANTFDAYTGHLLHESSLDGLNKPTYMYYGYITSKTADKENWMFISYTGYQKEKWISAFCGGVGDKFVYSNQKSAPKLVKPPDVPKVKDHKGFEELDNAHIDKLKSLLHVTGTNDDVEVEYASHDPTFHAMTIAYAVSHLGEGYNDWAFIPREWKFCNGNSFDIPITKTGGKEETAEEHMKKFTDAITKPTYDLFYLKNAISEHLRFTNNQSEVGKNKPNGAERKQQKHKVKIDCVTKREKKEETNVHNYKCLWTISESKNSEK
ncbi:hypothetical protein DdX_15431 [Ditylenchus destructor]|uniref:Uncharacterized protein n=1 Tax=Ditylenchus destructor TaxID=166010 RepID=A0AAD4MV07_9BILA|nr:hypothetical protein DdX_15431 [Ditylenchus destructor]